MGLLGLGRSGAHRRFLARFGRNGVRDQGGGGRRPFLSNPEKNLSSDREPSANTGLDIETKNLSATGRRRSFFVDIPFYGTTYLKNGTGTFGEAGRFVVGSCRDSDA